LNIFDLSLSTKISLKLRSKADSLKQFDQIDGFCAKINELFNGVFWSIISPSPLMPATKAITLTINQCVEDIFG
jgi:hypothetical protein